jgi:hypothetical protein
MVPGMEGRWRPLAERLALRRRPAPAPPPGADVPQHCWVVDCPEAPGRWPGLLLEWARDPRGWRGHVVMGVPGEHGIAVLDLWVPARHLLPAVRPGTTPT